jgi:hypothetical protein
VQASVFGQRQAIVVECSGRYARSNHGWLKTALNDVGVHLNGTVARWEYEVEFALLTHRGIHKQTAALGRALVETASDTRYQVCTVVHRYFLFFSSRFRIQRMRPMPANNASTHTSTVRSLLSISLAGLGRDSLVMKRRAL